MTVDRPVDQPGTAPSLPRSIWVIAWASLAGQMLLLARRGVRLDDEVSIALSVALGSLIVGSIAAGVVRARTVRLVLAWIVLVLSLVAEVVDLVMADDSGEAALSAGILATSVVTIAALASFSRTEWYAWQRTKPSREAGPPIGQLVAIAMLVGALGGLIGPADDGVDVRPRVSDHR